MSTPKTPAGWPHVFYGTRGRCYCAGCADGRHGLDKKPASRKDPFRFCTKCVEPILTADQRKSLVY